MEKIQGYLNRFELPAKYINTYPLRITTAWVKIFIYHKKGSFFETQIVYYAQKDKPYIPEGLIKINDDIYQLEIMQQDKTDVKEE